MKSIATCRMLMPSAASRPVFARNHTRGALRCKLTRSLRDALLPLSSMAAGGGRLNHIVANLDPLQHQPKLEESPCSRAEVPYFACFSPSTEAQGTAIHPNQKKQIQDLILHVKSMFQKLDLGEVSVSSYDTAWVAMVPSLQDPRIPQFPKCLDWIERSQLPDGSWGDDKVFLAFERLSNTLACVIALKTWSRSEIGIQKGIDFIHRNIEKLGNEDEEYMPVAFEVIFPSLLEDARLLGFQLPYASPVVQRLIREREKKLGMIPLELLHTCPTTLLYSLEGIHRLVDWEKILELQSTNGSFVCSTGSTACAFKYTRDKKCLEYLNQVLEKFHDAVPNAYPLELFERLWMVDRLERLGVSRYFENEIKDALDYVYKCWTDKGISWTKYSNIPDADDTAMAFRLLRLHGYPVSPEVFHYFKKDDQFYCFEGETRQSLTTTLNLHRAAQVAFPDEAILEEIYAFTHSFLDIRRRLGRVQDKWVISKGVLEEVSYSLDFPWWRSLPRVETRQYIKAYNVDDVWISKSLYRMPFLNNEVFMNLAILDYNVCQSLHEKELLEVLMWNRTSQFDGLMFARQKPKECFFARAATLFEPEYATARIVWTQMGVLATLIDDLYDAKGSEVELESFRAAIKRWDPKEIEKSSEEMKILFNGLYDTINMICQKALEHQGRDFTPYIREVVETFVNAMHTEAEWKAHQYCPTLEEYMQIAKASIAIQAVIQITSFFVGEKISAEWFVDPDYLSILNSVSFISRINNDIQGYKRESGEGKSSCVTLFMKENAMQHLTNAVAYFTALRDTEMKKLTQKVLKQSKFPKRFISLHLNAARVVNFIHSKGDGYTSPDAIYEHVKNTLFLPIA